MASPAPHDLARSGPRRRRADNPPCSWCGEAHPPTGLHAAQCAREVAVATARGWLPWRERVDDQGKVEFFVAFWQQLREALGAHDHAALALLKGPQFPVWCHLSGLDDYETARWGLLGAWSVHFGERPLFLHPACPRCGRADPADFWDNRRYCRHCEGEWKAQQKARKHGD